MAILNSSAQNKEHAGKNRVRLQCSDKLFYAADASSMCVQTIFAMIDHLTTWTDSKAKAAAVRRVKGAPQKGKRVEMAKMHTQLCST